MTAKISRQRSSGTREPVLVVLLRQPRMQVLSEMRSDPFWEFGSFGLTGCHQRNLLHPKNVSRLTGARLAFVQGGALGFRLVYLTEPVAALPLSDRTEVRWKPVRMPFRYADAPLVVDAGGKTDMPALRRFISGVNRNGWMGKFASKFRSRCEPLDERIAQQVIAANDAALKKGGSVLAHKYEDALPVLPPLVDRQRRKTYSGLLQAARARVA